MIVARDASQRARGVVGSGGGVLAVMATSHSTVVSCVTDDENKMLGCAREQEFGPSETIILHVCGNGAFCVRRWLP